MQSPAFTRAAGRTPHSPELCIAPTMRSYSTNAKGNFQFDRVISGWRDRPVLDLRLKK